MGAGGVGGKVCEETRAMVPACPASCQRRPVRQPFSAGWQLSCYLPNLGVTLQSGRTRAVNSYYSGRATAAVMNTPFTRPPLLPCPKMVCAVGSMRDLHVADWGERRTGRVEGLYRAVDNSLGQYRSCRRAIDDTTTTGVEMMEGLFRTTAIQCKD